jgi:hypothetical protein
MSIRRAVMEQVAASIPAWMSPRRTVALPSIEDCPRSQPECGYEQEVTENRGYRRTKTTAKQQQFENTAQLA